jgi:quinol-cytochrome oxidoreductase complex cytochrome b subunit
MTEQTIKPSRFQEFKDKALQAIDHRTRIITAGMGLDELRAVMRGDPPTERPNPRYKVHTTSFLFHIKPRYYEKASTIFSHTFRLGFLTTLFFFVETVTGLILMVYYTPSPEKAYGSIQNLLSNVAFGQLLRDVHRLGAEAMVLFTALHMLRTYLTGSYKQGRSFTWLTGVVLLLITLGLSFSGYLLPWDQLAYWAVTIGTSMVEAAPFVGTELNLLLRGGPDIGADGLLRFYLGHVVLLPLLAALVVSIHYYKVSREHGISLPARFEEGDITPEKKKEGKRRLDYIPELLTGEVFWTALGLLLLVILSAFFYHAPLEGIANPQRTPLDTEAPWYFLWLQGMLKIDPASIIENGLAKIGIHVELGQYLNSKTIMGIILPTIIFGILFAVPYIDRNPNRSLYKRPVAVSLGILAVIGLLILSFMGTPHYGIETPAATRIIQDMAPEEGTGPLHEVPFDQLQPGVYIVNQTQPEEICPDMPFGCPALEELFVEYSNRVNEAEVSGDLPEAEAVLVIEDWQENLRKVTPRITWVESIDGSRQIYSRHIYLHRDRGSAE